MLYLTPAYPGYSPVSNKGHSSPYRIGAAPLWHLRIRAHRTLVQRQAQLRLRLEDGSTSLRVRPRELEALTEQRASPHRLRAGQRTLHGERERAPEGPKGLRRRHRSSSAGADRPGNTGLVTQLAAQVTRTSGFRPPEGHARRSDPAVDHLLADLFAKKGKAFVLACFAKATDQGSFERLLLATIRNHLIDEAKGAERGKLRRRMAGLLGEDSRFRTVPAADAGIACWALADGAQQLWQGDITALEAAAADVRGVAIHRWNYCGSTRPSLGGVLRCAIVT